MKTTENFFVKKCNCENNRKNAVLYYCVPIEATLFGIAVVLHAAMDCRQEPELAPTIIVAVL